MDKVIYTNKCSCVICKKVYTVRGITTHYKVKHVDVQNTVIKEANSLSYSEKVHNDAKEKYYQNPKKCKKCTNVIEYRNRINKFCSKSCSASFNNSNRRLTTDAKNNISKGLEKFHTKQYSGKFTVLDFRTCNFCNKQYIYHRYNNTASTFCNKTCKISFNQGSNQYSDEVSIDKLTCITCNNPLEGKQLKFCSLKCKNNSSNNMHQSYNRQKERAIEKKMKILNEMGNECSRCHYNKNSAALCFHHIDPTTKEFKITLREFGNRSWDSLYAEIRKCILLCHNCHMEEHYPHYNIT